MELTIAMGTKYRLTVKKGDANTKRGMANSFEHIIPV